VHILKKNRILTHKYQALPAGKVAGAGFGDNLFPGSLNFTLKLIRKILHLPYGSPEKCAVFEIDKGRRPFA